MIGAGRGPGHAVDPATAADGWPDQGEIARWRAVLAQIAERLRRERGVDLHPFVRAARNSLWVHYDMAGPSDQLLGRSVTMDPEALFTAIDEWVAFVRDPAPEVLLERDHAHIAAERAKLVAGLPYWRQAVEMLSADIRATSSWNPNWQITLHEVGERPPPATGARLLMEQAGHLPPRTPPRLPYVSLDENDSESVTLSGMASVTLAHAVGSILTQVHERVIEYVWGAWPACPLHGHPMESACDDWDDPAATVYWSCPSSNDRIVAVGSLNV